MIALEILPSLVRVPSWSGPETRVPSNWSREFQTGRSVRDIIKGMFFKKGKEEEGKGREEEEEERVGFFVSSSLF